MREPPSGWRVAEYRHRATAVLHDLQTLARRLNGACDDQIFLGVVPNLSRFQGDFSAIWEALQTLGAVKEPGEPEIMLPDDCRGVRAILADTAVPFTKVLVESVSLDNDTLDLNPVTCTRLAQAVESALRQLDELNVLAMPPQSLANEGVGETPATSTPQASTNEGEGDTKDRNAILRQLEPAERKAYCAFQIAEAQAERKLQDREAFDLINENGLPDDRGNWGELADYQLPAFDTWARYLRSARNALGEQKHTPRAGRTGKSVVRRDQI